MNRVFGLSFEIKAVQPAITEGGRLRDLVGASELVDWLCRPDPKGDDLLAHVIAAVGVQDKLSFARRAGAAFRVFSDDRDALLRLRALWTFVVESSLSGLEVVTAVVEGDSQAAVAEHLTRAGEAARAARPVLLPVVGPFVRRAPRTGRPAERHDKVARELVDRLTVQKRKVTDKEEEEALDLQGLIRRFRPTAVEEGLMWPTTFEPEPGQVVFPLPDNNTHVAVVHADGNGLGRILLELHKRLAAQALPPTGYADAFFAFSQAISTATVAAASEAVGRVLVPAAQQGQIVPARPILLGGDDLTIIVRGDLAIPFTACFLASFARHTASALKTLREGTGPLATSLADMQLERLTAGAGIAFIKASQPFHLGLDLADSLTEFAKRVAKSTPLQPVPSVLAFHRVTTTLVDSYGALLERELSFEEKGQRRRLSLQPYAIPTDGAAIGDLPSLVDLEALAEWLNPKGEEAGSRAGTLREIAGRWRDDPDEAQRRYRRWHRVTDEREKAKDEDKRAIREFEARMTKLHGATCGPGGPGFSQEREIGERRPLPPGTPIVDALAWLAARAGGKQVPRVAEVIAPEAANG